eukprot:352605-Chlamydomonas_euryale.AAC.2
MVAECGGARQGVGSGACCGMRGHAGMRGVLRWEGSCRDGGMGGVLRGKGSCRDGGRAEMGAG